MLFLNLGGCHQHNWHLYSPKARWGGFGGEHESFQELAQTCIGSYKNCSPSKTKNNGSKIDNPGSSEPLNLSNTASRPSVERDLQRPWPQNSDENRRKGMHSIRLNLRSFFSSHRTGKSTPRRPSRPNRSLSSVRFPLATNPSLSIGRPFIK